MTRDELIEKMAKRRAMIKATLRSFAWHTDDNGIRIFQYRLDDLADELLALIDTSPLYEEKGE